MLQEFYLKRSCSLNLLFSDVPVAVGVVVFLNSLIARLGPRKFIFALDAKSTSPANMTIRFKKTLVSCRKASERLADCELDVDTRVKKTC